MSSKSSINREDFMSFFRDDEKLNDLSADDRLEIFRSILIGSSDFSKAQYELNPWLKTDRISIIRVSRTKIPISNLHT